MENDYFISNRIRWRAKRFKLPQNFYFDNSRVASEEAVESKILDEEFQEPVITSYEYKNDEYFILDNNGIHIFSSKYIFIDYADITEQTYPENGSKLEIDKIFLEGPNIWMTMPKGKHYFSICSILLMCSRMRNGK